MGLAGRSWEVLAVIWTGNVEFFFWISPKVGQQYLLNSGEDPFFGGHLISAGKTILILVKTFFFCRDHLILTEKPPQSD